MEKNLKYKCWLYCSLSAWGTQSIKPESVKVKWRNKRYRLLRYIESLWNSPSIILSSFLLCLCWTICSTISMPFLSIWRDHRLGRGLQQRKTANYRWYEIGNKNGEGINIIFIVISVLRVSHFHSRGYLIMSSIFYPIKPPKLLLLSNEWKIRMLIHLLQHFQSPGEDYLTLSISAVEIE